NAAIEMSTGDTLEGRALSTNGAVTVNGLFAYTPIGCGSPVLTGPTAPDLGSTECYAIFSASGAVSNTGITNVIGDVGTNVGSTTGYNQNYVTGIIHETPDASTAQAAADLTVAYNYLNTLDYDINLLYPAQFGNDLVLTPHTYLLNAATVFTGTLYLDAQGHADAVFVIKINGALSTSTYATVALRNGAQAKNVYWKIEGAVSINNYSVFNGTMVVNNGALGAINTGVVLNGRALTTTGALTTTAITAEVSDPCAIAVGMDDADVDEEILFYPNPFTNSITVNVTEVSELKIFDQLGSLVVRTNLNRTTTTIGLDLPSGVYFYQLMSKKGTVQTGKLISQQ
nr:DUF3494 domain-containing protein [Flavobacteriales bacterium]